MINVRIWCKILYISSLTPLAFGGREDRKEERRLCGFVWRLCLCVWQCVFAWERVCLCHCSEGILGCRYLQSGSLQVPPTSNGQRKLFGSSSQLKNVHIETITQYSVSRVDSVDAYLHRTQYDVRTHCPST